MSPQHAHDPDQPPERRSMPARVVALSATLVALAALLLAACGAQASAASNNPPAGANIGHVTITAQDYAFQMPSTVPAGPVEFTFVNHGTEVHQAQFFHLKAGVTADQFIASLKAGGPASTRSLGAPWGGIDETSPDQPAVHVVEVMAPGTYVVACLVRGLDGMFHYQMGMVGSFTVPPVILRPYNPPDNGTVTLLEMSIELPPAITQANEYTFKVVNDGTSVHAFDILQVAPAHTLQQVEDYLAAPSGPPPYILLGGVGGTLPGGTQWLRTYLGGGTYVAACLVVDPVSHKTHAAMGMYTPFTVTFTEG